MAKVLATVRFSPARFNRRLGCNTPATWWVEADNPDVLGVDALYDCAATAEDAKAGFRAQVYARVPGASIQYCTEETAA